MLSLRAFCYNPARLLRIVGLISPVKARMRRCMMAARDAMTYINEMDENTVQMFIDRLEFRGKDPTFVHYRNAYVAKMHVSPTAGVLEIG
jgi:hypothetical protein